MALLDTVITNTKLAPPKVIVHGMPGIGKTTFGAGVGGLLLDCEGGANTVQGLVRSPYLQTWLEMYGWLKEVATTPKPLDGLTVDTLDWMVSRIKEYVTIDLDGKKPNDVTNTVGTSHGGFYKGRDIIENIIRRFLLPVLNAITERGTPVILLAHSANVKMKTSEGFDVCSAAPDIEKEYLPIFTEWADAIFYATKDGNERVLITEGSSLIVAKNRYSLPTQLPLSWSAVCDAIHNSPNYRSK